MPYKIRGNTVIKDDGTVVKRHKTKRAALAHVIALNLNVTEDRDYKAEYDNYHSQPKQKKRRAQRNAARQKMANAGKVSKGDGKDVHHRNHKTADNSAKNLTVMAKSKNRSQNKAESMDITAKEADISLDEKARRIRDAWHAKYQKSSMAMTADIWVRDVYDDVVIVEAPDGLYSYPYTIKGDSVEDGIEFGEPTKVELTYQAAESRRIYLEAQIKPGKTEGFEGREWDVTIIGPKDAADIITIEGREYLRSLNSRLYSIDAIRESTPQWDGVKVFDNHLTDEEFQQRQGMRSVAKEWLGSIVAPWFEESAKQLRGIFKVAEETLAAKLLKAHNAGILSTIGLSIDTFPIAGQEQVIEGQRWPVIEGFKKILSVDLVAEPAAGGGFNRLIAANVESKQEQKTTMDEEQIKAIVADAVKAALAELAPAAEAETEQAEQVEEAAEEAAQPEQPNNDAAEQAAQEARLARCELLLERKLNAAKLPDAFRKIVEGQFAGMVFEEKALDAAIKRVKEAQAATDTSGRVSEASGQIQPGLDRDDKFAIEFARLMMGNADFNRVFGADKVDPMVEARLKESDHWLAWKKDGGKDLRSFSRLSTLIEEWAGGNPLFDQRAMETASTSSLATVVKNTVNIMVAADYSLQQRWYEPLVKIEEVDTIDDATLARLFGVNTLSVVAEGDAYTELALVDEEETASFVKKGNYIGITMETLMRDKINYVRTIPRRLSDTWYNTLSALVAGVFTVNSATGPVLSTTGALFNAAATSSAGGHANLLTAALSFTNFGAARTAMRAQTNQALGAGRKMLINPRYLLVPNDLETTALQIRNSELLPGSGNNDINPYYQQFDVVVVPDWTDANNWALMGDPMRYPAIFLIFPRGAMTPQLFTADNEATGAMFTNDTLRYKIRMLTYRFSSTYECAPVADFRPLHKNNVA